MKILANREGLLSAFQAVWGVVPSKSPKAILQNVKLIASEEDGTTLLATDLEVGLIRRVTGVKVDQPGAAILSARVLDILRSSKDEELSIEVEDEKIEIRGLRSNFKLVAENPDLFPSVSGFEAADYYRVSAGDLKAAIRRTIFAIDEESTRFALGGLLWQFDGDKLSIVSTDGRRLAECALTMEREGNPPDLTNGNGAPVLPPKAMKMLERSLADDETQVHISINSKNSASIWADDLTLYTRLVEGRFPRYQDVFPGEEAQRISLPAGDLLGGTAQAKIMTSEESRGVDFAFSADGLTFSAQGADVGAATIELPLSLGCQPVTITFDPQYLDQMLRTWDADQEITLNLIDAKHPMVINVGESYRYVAMPMTRDR